MMAAPFTAAQDEALLALRRAGKTWQAIGEAIGRPVTPRALRTRYDKLQDRAAAAPAAACRAALARERGCMTCRRPFVSAGPGNRLCDDCRDATRGGSLNHPW